MAVEWILEVVFCHMDLKFWVIDNYDGIIHEGGLRINIALAEKNVANTFNSALVM